MKMDKKIKTNMYIYRRRHGQRQTGRDKETDRTVTDTWIWTQARTGTLWPYHYLTVKLTLKIRLRSQFCHYIPVKPPSCPHSICLVPDSNFTLKIDTIDWFSTTQLDFLWHVISVMLLYMTRPFYTACIWYWVGAVGWPFSDMICQIIWTLSQDEINCCENVITDWKLLSRLCPFNTISQGQ